MFKKRRFKENKLFSRQVAVPEFKSQGNYASDLEFIHKEINRSIKEYLSNNKKPNVDKFRKQAILPMCLSFARHYADNDPLSKVVDMDALTNNILNTTLLYRINMTTQQTERNILSCMIYLIHQALGKRVIIVCPDDNYRQQIAGMLITMTQTLPRIITNMDEADRYKSGITTMKALHSIFSREYLANPLHPLFSNTVLVYLDIDSYHNLPMSDLLKFKLSRSISCIPDIKKFVDDHKDSNIIQTSQDALTLDTYYKIRGEDTLDVTEVFYLKRIYYIMNHKEEILKDGTIVPTEIMDFTSYELVPLVYPDETKDISEIPLNMMELTLISLLTMNEQTIIFMDYDTKNEYLSTLDDFSVDLSRKHTRKPATDVFYTLIQENANRQFVDLVENHIDKGETVIFLRALKEHIDETLPDFEKLLASYAKTYNLKCSGSLNYVPDTKIYMGSYYNTSDIVNLLNGLKITNTPYRIICLGYPLTKSLLYSHTTIFFTTEANLHVTDSLAEKVLKDYTNMILETYDLNNIQWSYIISAMIALLTERDNPLHGRLLMKMFGVSRLSMTDDKIFVSAMWNRLPSIVSNIAKTMTSATLNRKYTIEDCLLDVISRYK